MAEEKAAPVMSDEQKLRAVIAHREYIKAEAESKLAESRKQVTLQTLSDTIDKIGIELGVEKGKYTVNLDSLTLVPLS